MTSQSLKPFWMAALSACIVFLGALGGQTAPPLRYQVTPIGELGGRYARPVAINNYGTVVGTAPFRQGHGQPFVWQDGVLRGLPIGDGEFSTGTALDINDSGEIVATATVTNHDHGFLITASGVIDLNVQTGRRIFPTAINRAGLVVGYALEGLKSRAIAWSNGVLRELSELEPGSSSFAYAVNSQGDILGQAYWASHPGDSGPFIVLFGNGGPTVVPGIAGMLINDRGEIAGGIQEINHAALYQNGTVLDLGTLDEDIWSNALGLNNFGEVVGYSDDRAETPRAFVYTEGAMRDLNTLVGPQSGWTFVVANDINDWGQIVGVGTYKGQASGFLLTPIGKRNAERRKAYR